MNQTSATKRKTSAKRLSKTDLSNALKDLASKVRTEAFIAQQYTKLIRDSDYLRIINASGQHNSDQLSFDSLILLIVCLAGEITGPRQRWLDKVSNVATSTVRMQLKLLGNFSDSIWDKAVNVGNKAAPFVHRSGLDLCEELFFILDRNAGKTVGAYFTPGLIADRLVENVEKKLVVDCELPNGLASTESRSSDRPFVQILDPAAGSGAFLQAVLRRIVAQCTRSELANGIGNLVGRLKGMEVHPAVAAVCHCRLFNEYDRLGIKVEEEIPVFCGDALSVENDQRFQNISVVLGNPPFGSLTTNTNAWIDQLLKGEVDQVSYFELDGEKVRERKSWLHDDYVKFFRLAHYLIDRNQVGVIGFVTNRAYIDNLTFRAMRWQLINSFDDVEIEELDSTAGHFPVATDVAIGTFTKSAKSLRATQTDKTICHRSVGRSSRFSPRAPNFFFRPVAAVSKRYTKSFSIDEAMPFHGSAAITARDWFVTDHSREELCKRIEEFCDSRIGDDELRSRFFDRGRSRRYKPGDTRGWKMSEARERLRNVDWHSLVRLCSYRPYDWRWILWSPVMIDWPRTNLMTTLCQSENMAIVTRRQFPSSQPACYFWASNQVTIDGILRSDNRGNETLFPLYRFENGKRTSNFSPAFLDATATILPIGKETDPSIQLFYYIYGLFSTPDFRTRFGESLSTGFPRIVLSPDRSVAKSLIRAGEELLRVHLPSLNSGNMDPIASPGIPKIGTVSFDQENARVHVADVALENVSPEIWNFRIGTHQVLLKWLKDRRGRDFCVNAQAQYREVIDMVRSTVEIQKSLSQFEI